MNNRKKCFVIMPFSRTQSCTKQGWAGIFKGIIKPAVEESGLGYECERSVAERQNIVKGILEALNKANVVIADLTDNNPNVFYELGVRHTLTNRTILIAQGEEHIPFDLRPYPVTFYNKSLTNIEEFKNDIRKKLEDIETNPERLDNPVADFLKERNVVLLSTEKSANVKKFSALISELSRNLDLTTSILNTAKKNQKLRKEGKEEITIPAQRFETSCLELFLSSCYVAISEDLLKRAIRINTAFITSNSRLDSWHEQTFAESIEEQFVDYLPTLKKIMSEFLTNVGKISLDYINDNYQEPIKPPIILSRPEHEKYIKEIQ